MDFEGWRGLTGLTTNALEVDAQVARIINGSRLKNSPSLCRFLRFVVSESLQGRADSLKEIVLGEAVFDRGADFDPRIDPIVRVQAAKLRARLLEYYAGEGAKDPIFIELPKGAYVPVFVYRQSDAAQPERAKIEAPPAPQRQSRRWIAVGAVAALVGAAGLFLVVRRVPADQSRPSPRLTRMTYHEGSTSFPVMSRDGRTLVYASNRGGTRFSIWMQTMGSGSPVPLTHHSADDLTPDISPDGRLIAFRSHQDGGGIYLIGVDGTGERKVAGNAWLPRFSPDGSWLSCIGSGPGNEGILMTIPVAGGRPYEVATGGVKPVSAPVWSPDGQTLLFLGSIEASERGTTAYDWYLIPRAGGTAEALGLPQALAAAGLGALDRETHPGDWSGDTIVFGVRRESTANIWRIKLAQGSRKISGPAMPVTSGAAIETFPRLSAKGELLFASEERQSRVYAVRRDSTTGLAAGAAEQMTEDGFPSHSSLYPTLSKQGQRLAFYSSNLEAVDLVVREITSGRDEVIPQRRRAIGRPLVSADGRTILYLGGASGSATIYRARTGQREQEERRCAECDELEDWTRDGRWVLYAKRGRSSLMTLDWESGATREWLLPAPQKVSRAVLSPDNRRIALVVEGSGAFVLPFGPDRAAGRAEWVEVVDDPTLTYLDWAPDGSMLYFFSRRDGRQCLWARRVDTGTGRASGEVVSIAHFHNNRSSPWTGWISVGGDRVAFVMTEARSNIWRASLGQ